MSSTVTYKGNTLTTVDNATRKLNTKGKYLEDDITITDVSGGSSAVVVTEETLPGGGVAKHISAVDISDTTAQAADVAQGKYFYTAQGVKTAGTASGGGSSYTLLASEELTVNTTSTSTITIPDSTMVMPRSDHYQTTLYIQIRDKSGKRNGYFFGSDWYWTQPIDGALGNNYRLGRTLITDTNGIVVVSSTSTYGLYPQSPPTFSADSVSVTIVARYNSSYSTTIDGTYVVNVYSLAWPDGISPFA